MGSLWAFLKDENNQRTLGWLGAGGAVAAGGLWALMTYFWPHHDVEPAAPTVVCAQNGSVAAGHDASGNTVTFNGGLPTDSGSQSAPCPAPAKQ
jgi:hypothetical protein